MAETPKRKIDDAGEKIEGARKDWKSSVMTLDDLQGMTDEEIVLSVKKDHVWPKPDYEAMVSGGMAPEAAALVKVIRDRMAQEPRAYREAHPVALRKSFVEMTGLLRDLLTSCRTPDDVRAVYKKAQEAFGGNYKATEEGKLRFFSVFKSSSCPFYIDYKDLSRARAMLDEGFPVLQPAWKKGLKVKRGRDGAFWLFKGPRLLQDGFASEEVAWAWAEHNHAKGKTKKDDGKTEPKRPHLDRIERKGMTFSLEGRDISSEDFIEAFGFRGVQFGNWLPDGERQQVLSMGYEALMDLAEVLGWEPETLSLGGTLAIAFGARGNGGKAAAHYESGQRVVNMTRISGAGSFAHEFAHALDHWSGSGTEARVPGGIPSGSGWHGPMGNRLEILAHRGTAAAEAWEQVMQQILRSPVGKEEKLARIEQRIAAISEKVAKHRKAIDQQQSLPQERRDRSYLKQATAWIAEQEANVELLRAQAAAVAGSPEGSVHGYAPSSFLQEAGKLSGKSGDYWKRPNELFARAFEAWVNDEIAARGGCSQYLVNGVEEGRYAGEEYKGDPYPTGEERRRINEAMAAMAEAMRPEAELEAGLRQSPSPR